MDEGACGDGMSRIGTWGKNGKRDRKQQVQTVVHNKSRGVCVD